MSTLRGRSTEAQGESFQGRDIPGRRLDILRPTLVFSLLVGSGGATAECTRRKVERAQLRLRPVLDLPTQGNAGFEEFKAIDGRTYLASANFWDGKSPDMSATSTVYELTVDKEDEAALRATIVHELMTKGAHGADSFTALDGGDGHRFITFPSYYGCSSNPQLPCPSVNVLRLSKDDNSIFQPFQTIEAAGASQTDHVHHDGDTLLIVSENFASRVTIWALNPAGTEFVNLQSLSCPGVAATAAATVHSTAYLALASYHDRRTGWETASLIFRRRAGERRFSLLQQVPTRGCHDVDMLFSLTHGSLLLFFSEDRDKTSSRIESQLWALPVDAGAAAAADDDAEGPSAVKGPLFKKVAAVETDGAHAAELFEHDGLAYLAVANFGDRQGQRYQSRSVVYVLEQQQGEGERGEGKRKGEGKGDIYNLSLREVDGVASQGATDWEYFRVGAGAASRGYLALSNEGDIGAGLHQVSRVYALEVESEVVSVDVCVG